MCSVSRFRCCWCPTNFGASRRPSLNVKSRHCINMCSRFRKDTSSRHRSNQSISCFRVFSCGQSIRISRRFTEPTPLRVATDWAADESAHHGWRLIRSSQHRIPHERFPALLFNMAQSSHSAKPKPIVLCIELRLWTKFSVEVQSTTRAAVCERASSHIRCQCGSESPLVLFSNRTSTPYADYSRNTEQFS